PCLVFPPWYLSAFPTRRSSDLSLQLPLLVWVETAASVTVGVASQLSVAPGLAGALTALHSLVASAGTLAATNTGAVVSRTVTTCTAVLVFPQLSAAVHVRVIV